MIKSNKIAATIEYRLVNLKFIRNRLFFYKIVLILIPFIVMTLLSSCDKKESDNLGPKYSNINTKKNDNIYRFAVHPLYNPARLIEAYQPLINYLNKKIYDEQIQNVKLALEPSKDYANYESKFKDTNNPPHFLLPNPWQTVEAIKAGYNVIAMAGDANDFKGIFIVKKHCEIKHPLDLKGKCVSYPAPTALAACIMPQYFLYSHGIDINNDIKNLYVGSQESSIMNVYMGKSYIGVTWPPPWRSFQKTHPKESMELKVIWETPPLINNSVMVRKDDIPEPIKQTVCNALLELHDSSEGTLILSKMETSRFFKADNRSYDIVKNYIEKFEKNVRKIE